MAEPARIESIDLTEVSDLNGDSIPFHSNSSSQFMWDSSSQMVTAEQSHPLHVQEELQNNDASSSDVSNNSPRYHPSIVKWPSRDSLELRKESVIRNASSLEFEAGSQTQESSHPPSPLSSQRDSSDDNLFSIHPDDVPLKNTAPVKDSESQSQMDENVTLYDQQLDVIDALKGLGAWLERDASDRQAELRALVARIDQLANGLQSARSRTEAAASSKSEPFTARSRDSETIPRSALRSATQRSSPKIPRKVGFALDEVQIIPSPLPSDGTISPFPVVTPEFQPVPLPLPYPGQRSRRMSFRNDNSPWAPPASYGNNTPGVRSRRSSIGNYIPQFTGPSWGTPMFPPVIPPGSSLSGYDYYQPFIPLTPSSATAGPSIPPTLPSKPMTPDFASYPSNILPQPPAIVPNSEVFVSTDPFRIQPLSSAPQEPPKAQGGTETKASIPIHLPFPVSMRPPSVASSEKSRRIFTLIVTTVLQQVYLHFLLRLPYLYFSRVSRVFEDANLSLPDLKQMVMADLSNEISSQSIPMHWTVRPNSHAAPTLVNFKRSWESFIDSLLREWKTLNIVSVLLLSAILTILQIQGSEDPVTRTAALLSLVCALMSLLFGCIFIVRFGTMRRMYKAASWAQEAQKGKTSILWNVWVLLAIPAVWLSWSLLLFLTSILSFVWRTGSSQPDPLPLSPRLIIGPRIAITAVFVLGLLYFLMIVKTFKRYGSTMDKEWSQMVMTWTGNPHSATFPEIEDTPRTVAKHQAAAGIFVAPAAFTRPVNLTGPLSPFPAVKVDNMDNLSSCPEFPLDYAHHDVDPAEWKNFIEDLSLAWIGKHPTLDPNGNPIPPLKLAPDLIDIWNSEFFCHRALEVVLCKELHHEYPDLPRNSANTVASELSKLSPLLSSETTPRKESHTLYLTYVNCGERLLPSDSQRKFPEWFHEIPEQIHSILPLTISSVPSAPRDLSSDSTSSTALSMSTETPSFLLLRNFEGLAELNLKETYGHDVSGKNAENLSSAGGSELGIFSQ